MSKDEKYNPVSDQFDAELLLQSESLNIPGIHVEQVEEFEDMEALRDHVHSREYHVPQVDVVGPGGVPLRKEYPAAVQGRIFSEDQGPIKTKRKVLRNVLTRMDDMKGPLAVLRRCKESQTRVKVYTRNHIQIRGIITGHVIAFDKHWNIVLKDCEEVYVKKILGKTPSFGDVSNVISVSDLSINCDDYDQGSYQFSPLCVPRVQTKIPSYAWPNPFTEKTTKKGSQIETKSSSSNLISDQNIDHKYLMEKYSKDATSLKQARAVERPIEGDTPPKRRRRRRKKEELRFREVKQILVRGEMVVMVTVCSESD